MALEYLIYVSKETDPMSKSDLERLLETSKANNKDLNVTGMLLYVEGRFFQVLEGEDQVLDYIFSKIKKDTRHKNIILVARGILDRRIFSRWSMRFNSITKSEFLRISGITKFTELLTLKPRDSKNPASMFIKKFSDKTFPSPAWWGAHVE